MAVFSATSVTTPQTVKLNAARAVSGLRFTSAQPHSLLGGNANQTLTLGASGITVDAGAGAATIGSATNGQNVSIVLSGTQTWTNNSANVLTIKNGVSEAGKEAKTLTFAGAGNIAVVGTISASSGDLGVTKNGSGTVALSGSNTYNLRTVINAGVLSVGTLANGGTASGIGQSSRDAANLVLAGGTLQYTGATAQGTNRDIRVGLAGGTIDASGSVPSATMNFTKSTTNVDVWDTDGGRMLTLTGSNTGNNTFGINWQERAAGHSSLVKSGTGTWVLTNPHNSDGQTDAYNAWGGYGGGTPLSGGTLGFVNNAIGGGVVDFTGNATLRWESGNTQDLSTGTGAGVARSVKIEDGVRATFNTNGNNVTLSNALAVGPHKTGALTKDGAGILTLSANNNYDGATTVSAGTLVVNGNQAAANGAVSVSGTLAGTGTVGGATTINAGGTHAPGAVGVVGNQNFSGNLHYAADSIFEWDLNANSTDNPYGMAFDMVGAGGNVVVDTSSTVFRIVFGPLVNMSDSFWSTPFVTRIWAMSTLFGKAISGAFQTVDTGSYPVNPSGRFSIDGEYLYYSSVEESAGASVVPEPTGALAGLLLGGGLLRRRRRASVGAPSSPPARRTPVAHPGPLPLGGCRVQ